ncbi:hypothetical protein [Roseivirga pacifica]|uniref:hypothetical protein n=1 Tax=Roseivirga pacifica TaxID=1267423 RepID=UPI00209548AD|nr:hypothetical protein [Roseivirga pacifica]MCO6358180.1 hypothetical protein [Roseivirga pacifica]MCO6366618.1 hypothetical protein [Roseivirga pacifica]MCO6371103.1 hypothetical protein [Roseivirga pacifica]MCO6373911.1 hypothetical protein [Roseivirga pacifica]MCO6380892.1 hypothetical protein [Roseivirga pacifica]
MKKRLQNLAGNLVLALFVLFVGAIACSPEQVVPYEEEQQKEVSLDEGIFDNDETPRDTGDVIGSISIEDGLPGLYQLRELSESVVVLEFRDVIS